MNIMLISGNVSTEVEDENSFIGYSSRGLGMSSFRKGKYDIWLRIHTIALLKKILQGLMYRLCVI